MTLYELLQTPLMMGAKVLAGQEGLNNEVTWTAPDTDIDYDHWIMPGLLLLHTPTHEKRPWPETSVKMDRANPAGIILFANSLTNLMESIIRTQDYSYYNEKKLPLVLFPRGTNMLAFSKRFTAIMAAQFVTEYKSDEWLRELAYSGIFSGGESVAKSYGYQPELNYFCLLIDVRGYSEDNPIQLELDLNMARGFLSKEFHLKKAAILSFIDWPSLILFIPQEKEAKEGLPRVQITSAVHRLTQALPQSRWLVSVGTPASALAEFYLSYHNAWKTARIVNALQLSETLNFYDDWYMHILLLKEPKAELRTQVNKILSPILSSPELLETLSNYLAFGENLKLTSEKMYIHVNTLKYRIQRISELLNCNLKDPNVRFRLRMAIVIEQYLQSETTPSTLHE